LLVYVVGPPHASEAGYGEGPSVIILDV
jgi:hypothetical protein